MSFCQDCIKGVIDEGTPAGKIETIHLEAIKTSTIDTPAIEIECYVATPTVDYPKDKVILLLTDVFGLSLINNKLLADSFAENGFKTVMPDLFRGDPVPADAVLTPPSKDADAETKNIYFNIYKWFEGKDQAGNPSSYPHDQPHTHLIIDKVIEKLHADGVKHIAAVGYCFGGRYVFDLAFKERVISVAAVAHPSLLQIPADLEKYAANSKAPLLINSCEVDEMFPKDAQAKADEVFAGFPPGYKREYFEGCEHGFAVRGDMSIPEIKAAKERAFEATVEWFKKYLYANDK